ncbi:MAG: alpha/beta fold hydrolase [Lachnospiraceae bacterium]
MKKDFYYQSRDGVTTIHAIEWIPEGEIKAVLQISHGMVEYIDRYDDFAKYLNKFGYYVVGNDHLGHGESVVSRDKYGYFAHPYGNECVVADIHMLRKLTQKKYPDIPYYMLGHSMGSFLLRQYIELHGEGLSGAVIIGTGSQPGAVLDFGMICCKVIAGFHGWEYRSSFLNNLAFSLYNEKFQPIRTDKDWLSKDEEQVDAYKAHPWCNFIFTVNGFYHMFRGIRYIQKKKNIEIIPKNLPVLFAAGTDDPVGAYGKGVKKAYSAFVSVGITDVSLKMYVGDRHEILNETDRKKVYEDIKDWIERHL